MKLKPSAFLTFLKVAGAGLCLAPAVFAGQNDIPVTFSEEERAFILSHGPWPPPVTDSADNQLSGQPAAISFGRKLFKDPRLSRSGTLSCASCHRSEHGFSEPRSRSVGRVPLERNAPAIANLSQNRWFGWDGSNDTLWGASIRPILNPDEFAMDAAGLWHLFMTEPDLLAAFSELGFGQPQDLNDQQVLVLAGKALAAYQERLTTPKTAFDRFRDALETGDKKAMASYPKAAKLGLKLFTGKGQCSNCHFGPAFTNGEFHTIGLPHFTAEGAVDGGRFTGIQALRASPFTSTGPHSPLSELEKQRQPIRFLALNPDDWGNFRVPSLRNVAATAPYMHDGSLATLQDVITHYRSIDPDRIHNTSQTLLKPIDLSEQEITALIAFLESLSAGPVETSGPDIENP